MAIKLSKVIKDLNVGRQTIEEFLHKKGIDVDSSINARIQYDVYEILIQHFRPELAKKLISNYKRTKDYKRHNLLNKTDYNDRITNDSHVTYPLISEYVEAIKLAEDNLDQLSHLRPVLDKDGRPVMSSGNFAVVFKMKDENDGKLYALKCFTREQEGRKRAYQQISKALKEVSSPYLVSIRYLANELFVNSQNSSETEFPVVVMDWVNGQTLDNYIKLVRYNQDKMNHLTSEFFKLAGWLLKQPFAHGDLKPDNILVQEDGSLVLVDYDGMYVPAMKGQPAREIGSPNFRLPNRDINTFDRNIDDFPITTISLALRAITLNPDLLDEFNANDALLFVEDDFHNIASCKLYHKLCAMLSDNGINQLILALHLSFTGVPIGDAYFKILGTINESNETEISVSEEDWSVSNLLIEDFPEVITTDVTDDDINMGIIDEFGVIYSPDRKRLLKATKSLQSYVIKPGTRIIADEAFWCSRSLASVVIPDSVSHIGSRAFEYCEKLKECSIPNTVVYIGNHAFRDCESITDIFIPNSVTHIEDWTFNGCKSLTSIIIPNSVISIGNAAFGFCFNLTNISIPNSVTSIGCGAFSTCCRLVSIIIPNSVTYIGKGAFFECQNLKDVKLPNSITCIENELFYHCTELFEIKIPDSVTSIGDYAFGECDFLTKVNIPDSVTKIGSGCFSGCHSLRSIFIPNSITQIDSNAFSHSGLDLYIDSKIYISKGSYQKFSRMNFLSWVKFEEVDSRFSSNNFSSNDDLPF